jgi:hypothetical protein
MEFINTSAPIMGWVLSLTSVIVVLAGFARWIVKKLKEPLDEIKEKQKAADRLLLEHMDEEREISKKNIEDYAVQRRLERKQIDDLGDYIHEMWDANHEAHLNIIEALASGQREPYYMVKRSTTNVIDWVWGNAAYFKLMDISPAEALNDEYWYRIEESDRRRIKETVTTSVKHGTRWEGIFNLYDRNQNFIGKALASQVPIVGPEDTLYFIGTVQIVDDDRRKLEEGV